MTVLEALNDAEKYLVAILQDASGIDIAEFLWRDHDAPDDLFRCYDFQYFWYRCDAKQQIDQSARSVGKALDVATPVPVLGGWTTMGDLTVGDLVYGTDGRPIRVTHAYEPLINRECFEITFTTGDHIVADRDHLWTVVRLDLANRASQVLTTANLVERGINANRGEPRFGVDVAAPVIGLRHVDLPIPPWLLGYWLGDGTSRTGQITVGEEDIIEFVARVEVLGYHVKVRPSYPGKSAHIVSIAASDGTQFGRQLTAIGAKLPDRRGGASNKTIPSIYLLGSIDQRLELLRGFMDADGCGSRARASFDLMDSALADQFIELVCSLGERVYVKTGRATLYGRDVGERIRVGWRPRRFVPFSYKRKADLIRLGQDRRRHMRSIRSIVPVSSRTVRCIEVDSDDCLFLVGRGHIATHNSLGIQMRAFAFPYRNPGNDMLITAPELIHLDPITKNVEDRLLSTRLSREMLKGNARNANGITHRPFEARFWNDAKIIGRIPQKDGRGIKGQHPRMLEQDEAADYPLAGWVELIETLRYGDETARWRAHGVPRGTHGDHYYRMTQSDDWFTHRITSMHRHDWSDAERKAKAELYGSRDHPDYRRNLLGLHGSAQSPLFVLSRLMGCADTIETSDYNLNIYQHIRISHELLQDTRMPIEALIDIPGTHKLYSRVWIGEDVGMTNHPSEIIVVGGENIPASTTGGTGGTKSYRHDSGGERLRILTRIHLERISAHDQLLVMKKLVEFYKPVAFGIDRGGLGLPIFSMAQTGDFGPELAACIRGYDFGSKIPVGFTAASEDENEWTDPLDRAIMGNVLEASSDYLRLLVDQKKLVLPWDSGLLKEFQGQSYYIAKDVTNPYGKKQFSRGSYHALDACRMFALAYSQEIVEKQLSLQPERSQVLLTWLDDIDYAASGGGGTQDQMFDW